MDNPEVAIRIFAESYARIYEDGAQAYSPIQAMADPGFEIFIYFPDDILLARIFLHGLRRSPHVHQYDACSCSSGNVEHMGVM